MLAPEPGERLLEIGVGTGYYSLDLAEWVGPTGRLELFDLQREFLDHVMRAAGERGLANLVPTEGDATALPFEDASVDAVLLTAVLATLATNRTSDLLASGDANAVALTSGYRLAFLVAAGLVAVAVAVAALVLEPLRAPAGATAIEPGADSAQLPEPTLSSEAV